MEPAGQGDANQPARGNHDGGVIAFGPDGKLYIFYGDQGRRGWLQNLQNGPPPEQGDDQFGGPSPDNAHLTGVVLRLNPDGTIPADNPFFAEGARRGGEVGTNIQKVFAYGLRNSFGIAFDPSSGALWISEHGDDTFDEINLVYAGMNGGWVQVAGPLSRIEEFKGIETTFFAPPEQFPSLQQWRYPPSLIADNAVTAQSRMFMLPGAFYSDPQFSWRWATLPSALVFAPRSFGQGSAGNLLVQLTRNPMTSVGYLMSFPVHPSRRSLELPAGALNDRVADNSAKYDLAETEPLIVGQGFGIATDMQVSPRNSVYVVSFTKGAIYEIARSGQGDDNQDDPAPEDDSDGLGSPLRATLSPALFGDRGDGDGSGAASLRLHSGRELVCFEMTAFNLDAPGTVAIFQGAADGTRVLDLGVAGGSSLSGCVSASRVVIRSLRQNPGGHFVSVRNSAFPEGAISGPLQ